MRALILTIAIVFAGCSINVSRDTGFSSSFLHPMGRNDKIETYQVTGVGIALESIGDTGTPTVRMGYWRYQATSIPAAIAEGDIQPDVTITTTVNSGAGPQVQETFGVGELGTAASKDLTIQIIEDGGEQE